MYEEAHLDWDGDSFGNMRRMLKITLRVMCFTGEALRERCQREENCIPQVHSVAWVLQNLNMVLLRAITGQLTHSPAYGTMGTELRR